MSLRAVIPVLFVLGSVAACGAANGTADTPAKGTGSIRAVLDRDPITGAVFVYDVPEGLAASEAGMEPGDQLKMIDGVHVDDLDRDDLQQRLRGPIGSTVNVTVVRGDEVLHLDVKRQVLERVEKRGRYERIE